MCVIFSVCDIAGYNRKPETLLLSSVESSRKEPEYICISSDSEDDDDYAVQIPTPKPAKTQKHHNSRSTPPISAKLKQESGQDAAPPDESSGNAGSLHPIAL